MARGGMAGPGGRRGGTGRESDGGAPARLRPASGVGRRRKTVLLASTWNLLCSVLHFTLCPRRWLPTCRTFRNGCFLPRAAFVVCPAVLACRQAGQLAPGRCLRGGLISPLLACFVLAELSPPFLFTYIYLVHIISASLGICVGFSVVTTLHSTYSQSMGLPLALLHVTPKTPYVVIISGLSYIIFTTPTCTH